MSVIENNKEFEQNQYDITINHKWLISADTIFSSLLKGYEKYHPILTVEFGIKQISMFDGKNHSDVSFCANDIQITMPSGLHCAELQIRMQKSKKVNIKEIIIVKTVHHTKIEIIEEKKYKECVVQSFFYNQLFIGFSFKCQKYEETYKKLNAGQASVAVDLATWEIKK